MSSSNLVQVTAIEEVDLGVTPLVGDFKAARFTSESLSGSPETTQSQQIRTDRMASGQIVTGLTVGGDLNFELSSEDMLEDFMESAMLNKWNVMAAVTTDLVVDPVTKTIARVAGDFDLIAVGDIITLSGFAAPENNVEIQVILKPTPETIKYISKDDLVAETLEATYKRADKLTIGAIKKSYSIEKAFLDIAGHALIYKGMMANTFSINIAYGEIITGSFGFNGTKYVEADIPAEMITNGRTIIPAATSNSMNGSIDMPFLATSALGVLEQANFCIQSVSIALNNNYIAQTCIGEAAPRDYSPGTADIEINLSTYLSSVNWPLLSKKLTQEPIALGFMVKNLDGWYGFYLPAIQLTFDDPASGGQNQEVSLDASGVARVGLSGESSLVIYRN